MSRDKIRGIVLRSVKYAEHDRMLTVFSLEKGKLSVCAKGARSAKSQLLAVSQPFALSEIVLGGSRGSYISSARLMNGFFGLQSDILKVSAAAYMCQLIEVMTEDESADENLFRLLYWSLATLENASEHLSPLMACCFALKLMGISGMAPRLECCMRCGEHREYYRFDYSEGGLVCTDCAGPSDMPALKASEAMRLLDMLYWDIKSLPDMDIPDAELMKHLLRTVNDYVIYMSGRSIRSFDMLFSLL
ncbi:MAG: DNA repair protein RecO [Eubacteriaceae bacterium]|nr:DNA repair protein RecO [Eubacteriaceae bacterium]